MNGFITLSEKDRGKELAVGDFASIDILVETKVGARGDQWKIKGADTTWAPAGGLTLAVDSLKETESEGNTTKLSADALVHQINPVVGGPFTLLHVPTGTEINIDATTLAGEAKAVTQSEEAPTPWTLPPIAFGGWNWFVIVLLSAALLTGLFFLVRRLLRKLPGRKGLDHYHSALKELQSLQKFARNRKGLQQEEWKKFSFDLAGIIRKYSDQNFVMDSRDMTDREFLAHLRYHAKAKDHVNALATLLSTIDEVRYGKKELDSTLVPGLIVEARNFLARTYQPKDGEGGK